MSLVFKKWKKDNKVFWLSVPANVKLGVNIVFFVSQKHLNHNKPHQKGTSIKISFGLHLVGVLHFSKMQECYETNGLIFHTNIIFSILSPWLHMATTDLTANVLLKFIAIYGFRFLDCPDRTKLKGKNWEGLLHTLQRGTIVLGEHDHDHVVLK